MSLNFIARLARAAQWASSPQGKNVIRKAAKFASEHKDEIDAAKQAVKTKSQDVTANLKKAANKFKEEMNKED